MFCRKCGNIIEDGDAFCRKCGNPTTKNTDEVGASTIIQKANPKAEKNAKKRSKLTGIIIGILVLICVGIVLRPFIIDLFFAADSSKDDKKSDSEKKVTNTTVSAITEKPLPDTDNIKGRYSFENESLTITWDAVPGADKYELSDANSMRVHEYLFNDPVAVIVEGTSYTVYGVKSKTNYIVRIRAVKGSGNNAIYSEGKDREFDIP